MFSIVLLSCRYTIIAFPSMALCIRMYLSGVVHALGDSDVEGLLSRVLCGISTWYVARCYETPQPNTRLWLVGSPFYVSACVQLCRRDDGREDVAWGNQCLFHCSVLRRTSTTVTWGHFEN